jgi:hypothetical protein
VEACHKTNVNNIDLLYMLARGVPIAIGRKPASAAAERIWSGTPEQNSNRKRNVAAPKVYKIKIGNKNVNRYDK